MDALWSIFMCDINNRSLPVVLLVALSSVEMIRTYTKPADRAPCTKCGQALVLTISFVWREIMDHGTKARVPHVSNLVSRSVIFALRDAEGELWGRRSYYNGGCSWSFQLKAHCCWQNPSWLFILFDGLSCLHPMLSRIGMATFYMQWNGVTGVFYHNMKLCSTKPFFGVLSGSSCLWSSTTCIAKWLCCPRRIFNCGFYRSCSTTTCNGPRSCCKWALQAIAYINGSCSSNRNGWTFPNGIGRSQCCDGRSYFFGSWYQSETCFLSLGAWFREWCLYTIYQRLRKPMLVSKRVASLRLPFL